VRLELTGRHFAITPAVRKIVAQRLAKLTRMLNDAIVSVQIVVSVEKTRTHVEMTLHARGDHFLHGEATGRDLATALGAAATKVEHQAQKMKSKWTEGRRQGVSAGKAASATPRPERARRAFGSTVSPEAGSGAGSGTGSGTRSGAAVGSGGGTSAAGATRTSRAAANQVRIVRARRYAVKPMTVDDAALEVADGTDAFIVFRNSVTDTINVLFRRPDGHLGLIEPEA
jgi:putative sigma-54 modulation protein